MSRRAHTCCLPLALFPSVGYRNAHNHPLQLAPTAAGPGVCTRRQPLVVAQRTGQQQQHCSSVHVQGVQSSQGSAVSDICPLFRDSAPGGRGGIRSSCSNAGQDTEP
eukprot:251438-Chlamydomonas_euryale.AAC.1